MNRGDSKPFLKDGSLTFSGGVDASRQPNEVGKDQTSTAVNATMRGGPASPRPGWKRRPLKFANGCMVPFQGGFFQSAGAIYNGPNQSACLSSQGGRQFSIDIDSNPGVLTTTTAPFTIPAVNATVTVQVANSSQLYSDLSTITIGIYQLTLVSIDSMTQITVKNTNVTNVGTLVVSASNVQFVGTWTVREITPVKGSSTKTTADFTIPAVGATVNVSVLNATQMANQLSNLTIGGYPFVLQSVNSATSITVVNNMAGNVGIVVSQPADITFSVFDSNNPNQRLNWSVIAENYWILQDNQSNAIYYDGSKSLRANPATNQIPIGNVMCYTMGRLSVSLPDRQSYRIGDIVRGSSGTAANNGLDAILFFTETNFTNEGGDEIARVFGAPSNSGPITAMKASAMTDTALGQGPMIVGTPNVVFTVNLPFDRTTWKNLTNPMQTANPIIGPTGQNSTLSINTDLWYRALDGIRSYITAQRQFNGSWANTALSNEVDFLLASDTRQWLEYGSAVLFDNRLLMTVSPQMTDHGVFHRGLVSLDFDLVTNMRGRANPAWEGVWTGIRILQIMTGVVNRTPRCFMYVLNDESKIELWELSTAEKTDDGNDIPWELALGSYNCGDSDRFKKLKTARLVFINLTGTLTCTVQYRTDESSCYNDWTSFARCAKSKDCGPPSTSVTIINNSSGAIDIAWASTINEENAGGRDRTTVQPGQTSMMTQAQNGNYIVLFDAGFGPTPDTGILVGPNFFGTITVAADQSLTSEVSCFGPITYAPQVRWPIRLSEPPDTADPLTRRPRRTGYEFQPKLIFTGYAQLNQFRLFCMDEPEALGVDRMDES